jgi:outer membrane biosynthesis protein TonB
MGEVTQSTYKKARIAGYLGSGGTGLILFLILFFTYLITPIPPYPEGGGGRGMDIEVNLGYADEGLGDIQQPDIAMPEFNEQVVKTTAPVEEPKQEVITQENEETTTITTPPKTKKKITPQPKQPQPQAKKTIPKKAEPVVEKPRTVNKAALYKSNSKSGNQSSQGVTKGDADQGDPNGLQGSATYRKGGSGGDGSGGGTGGGTGTGSGTGIGNGVGPGISFNLAGRSMVLIRKPEFSKQKEGIVVVEITVDRNGKVVNASPGVKGSTIVDNTLYSAAKKAALESRFNLKSDAPDLQVGKIIYHFKLQ